MQAIQRCAAASARRLVSLQSRRNLALGMDFVARRSVNYTVNSLQNEESSVDTPTIFITEPVSMADLELDKILNRRPRYTQEQLQAMIQGSKDPFDLVQHDLAHLSDGIKGLLDNDHPVLAACARYFFELDGGKKIRPTMVLLMSHALSGAATPAQRRLAEITEIIHTASLFHDDVIDKASTRRGVESVNRAFGNKMAILGGDFLLSRASVMLARLRDVQVVELMSSIIEHLVKGEVMQMRPLTDGATALEYYLRKNYYKTASLMSNSCRSTAVLANQDAVAQQAAYQYGKYVGLAFQLIDDVLDFEGSSATLGKPSLADLKSGLATAPVLFAADQHEQMVKLMERKFDAPGDVDEAVRLVETSDGIQRSKNLAQIMAEMAIDSLAPLPSSEAKDALVSLACKVVVRNH